MDTLLGNDDVVIENEFIHINDTCQPSLTLTITRDAEYITNVIVLIIGLPLNFIVLSTQLLVNRIYKPTTPTLYLTNLYFCNMLTLLVLPYIILSNKGYVSGTPSGCKFASLTYYGTCTAGFATLSLIAINRYRVLHQKTTQQPASRKQTYTVLTVTWAISLFCSIPPSLYTTVVLRDAENNRVHETCIVFFDYDHVKTVFAAFKVLLCIIWGVAPIILMCWFYLFFYKRLKRTSYKRRSNTLAFISALMLSFLILQIPLVFIMLFESYAVLDWDINCENINNMNTACVLARLVPNVHCLLNPILYAFLGRDFNKRLMQCFKGELFSRRRALRLQAGIGHQTRPKQTSTVRSSTSGERNVQFRNNTIFRLNRLVRTEPNRLSSLSSDTRTPRLLNFFPRYNTHPSISSGAG